MEKKKGGDALPLREKVGYGLGDMACSMVFNFMSSYLLYYYTDVAGIAVGAAGAVMSAARLVDAFANPVVGMLSDKTRSRWGKLRPWLLFSAVPLALSVVLMFLTAQVPSSARGAYAMVTYAAFCLLYTVCNVPYSAMMPNLTEDPGQRRQLNMSRMALASTGGFLSMGLAMPLAGLFGQGDEHRGFLGLSLLFAAIIITLVLFCFFNTKERIQSPPVPFSLRTLGSTVRKSTPWVLCCAVQFFHYFATATRNSTTLYYAKYHLGDQDFASLLLAVSAIANFVCAFIGPALAGRVTKKAISLWGYGLFAGGSALMYLAGDSLPAIFLLNCVINLGAGLAAGVYFLILGEAIDHSEYAVGVRQEGLLTSMSMFMVKLGIVFSSLLSAFVLEHGGYVPDQPQTEEALFAIKANFIFLPCAAALVCVVLFLFYHLDKEYPAIHAELGKKHKQM